MSVLRGVLVVVALLVPAIPAGLAARSAPRATFPEASLAASYVMQAGVGGFSASDLSRVLAGKLGSATPFIGLSSHGVSGGARPSSSRRRCSCSTSPSRRRITIQTRSLSSSARGVDDRNRARHGARDVLERSLHHRVTRARVADTVTSRLPLIRRVWRGFRSASGVSRIKLNDLSSSGVHLTPHEAVAVVHQVCNLLKVERRGSPLHTPTLDELFVTDEGEIGIEPQREPLPRVPLRSLSQLVDELLDPDAIGNEKNSGGESRMYGVQTHHRPIVRFGATSTVKPGDERAVLRQLFDRAQVERPPAIPDSAKAPTVEPIESDAQFTVFFEAPSDLAFADQVEQSAADPAPQADEATVSENAERFFEPAFTTLPDGRGGIATDGLAASSGEVSRQGQQEAAPSGSFFGERQEAVFFPREDAGQTTSSHREEAESATPELRIQPADIAARVEPTTVEPNRRASRSATLFVQPPPPEAGRGLQVLSASFLMAAVAAAVAGQWSGVMDFDRLLPGRTTGANDEIPRLLSAGLPDARADKGDVRPIQAVDGQAAAPIEVSNTKIGGDDATSWSPATRDELATLQTPRWSDDMMPFGDARISPDGRWIAFVDERGRARGACTSPIATAPTRAASAAPSVRRRQAGRPTPRSLRL